MKIRSNMRILLVAIFATLAMVSCISETSVPNDERERISLKAWIELNRPELLNNYQEEGGYYVEILDERPIENESASGNDFGTEPLLEQDTCWVYTNMTGRDINGAICMTRSGELAEMCGTFSYSTHYVPYINFCSDTNVGLLEGTHLSMRHELTLSDEFCTWYKEKYGKEIEQPYKMRKGSKVRLYLPSTIAFGESGSSMEGGYEGQFSLDASRPLIMDIEVLGAIKNPSDKELEMVTSYIVDDDDWTQAVKPESEKTDENDDLRLKGLYYKFDFNPKSDEVELYKYMQPHLLGANNPYKDTKKYVDIKKLNREINEILLNRFGEGLTSKERTEKTEVTKDGRANVWYVLRFLDGFVVDTNIAEIRTLVFGESAPECEAFSYSPSDDEGKGEVERSAIGAWYYCIPKMHHGAYGQIITTSGYAYGSAGVSGTTTTTESTTGGSYYNPYGYYNYYNYYNSYYGSYGNPYYDYYNYYNYYNYEYDAGETVTTTTIGTEILPYTPLVFTIFVDPKEE